MEEATNVMVSFHGVQVRPGDIVMGDITGVVFIPQERLEDVVAKAETLLEKEEAMVPRHQVGHVDDGSRQKIQL